MNESILGGIILVILLMIFGITIKANAGDYSIVASNKHEIEKGDYVSVVSWKSHINMEAHKTSVLEVIDIDQNMILVEILEKDPLPYPIRFIIDANNATLRKLSDEFVESFIESFRCSQCLDEVG